jgi:hypothetical protein
VTQQTYVPQQPGAPDGGPAPPGAARRTPPHVSEATRLLCAGTYLDEGYRQAVIEELYVHQERVVAPKHSPGLWIWIGIMASGRRWRWQRL